MDTARLDGRPLAVPSTSVSEWAQVAPSVPDVSGARLEVDGLHLARAGRPFVMRGVTYGSFVPRPSDGAPYPPPAQVAEDLAAIADLGLNTVRVYDLPPDDVLDAAARNGLVLIVGLSYHDWRMERRPGRSAQRRIRAAGLTAVDDAMARLAGRPEVAAVSIANEVPGDLVRVHGVRSVERILGQLARRVHAHDPGMLVTATNYPTTEYLRVPGVDLVTFNVFLEDPDRFAAYLAHLQVTSGPRPLVLTELGLAAAVHGEQVQARTIAEQLDAVARAGIAGATVFAWTDEWGVGGVAVEGWGFGVTTADRRPKPAVEALRRWAAGGVELLERDWPSLSVIVCAYNEERTIGACVESLLALDYPGLEVIVCDDGSTDATPDILSRLPVRVLRLEHGGLSRARNAGLEAASGEIVAYLDADAIADPRWPWFLALSFDDAAIDASGGPNLAFPDADTVEWAVARAPGTATEVLISARRAEHVPGCNLAFRRSALIELGGFDPIHRRAGDDVDVCWKVLDRGRGIGFAPAAQVWHHRRSTVTAYLRQQRGYGEAERALAAMHPARFNRLGQARWSGFIYGGVGLLPRLLRPVVYHGVAGTAPFQPISRDRASAVAATAVASVPTVVVAVALGLVVSPWWPGGLDVALAGIAVLGGLVLAFAASVEAERGPVGPAAEGARGSATGTRRRVGVRGRLLVGLLHVLQPLARARGRLGRSLAPPPQATDWNGDRDGALVSLVASLHRARLSVGHGGPTDGWDLAVSIGPLLRRRLTVGVAWGWVPQVASRTVPSPAAVFAVAAVAVLLEVRPASGLLLAGCILLLATVEAGGLGRRIDRALPRPPASVTADEGPA